MSKLMTFSAFKHLQGGEDYYVIEGDDLRALQCVLLDMMEDIDAVCRRNGISYMLFSGSCLGAYRHGGFIPWDDDLDIAMGRPDYLHFREVFGQELGDGYILQTPEDTHNLGLAFARIRKRGTTLKCRDDLKSDGECGVYIDLFIWESVPNNALLRGLHGFGSLALGLLYSCRRFAWFGDTYLRFAEGDAQMGKVFKFKNGLGKILSFASLDGWTRAWYRYNALCKKADSKYVTIPCGRRKYFGDMLDRGIIFPMREVPFEDTSLFGPNDVPRYLQRALGEDYMTPPPVEAREKHVAFAFDLGEAAEAVLAKHGKQAEQDCETPE